MGKINMYEEKINVNGYPRVFAKEGRAYVQFTYISTMGELCAPYSSRPMATFLKNSPTTKKYIMGKANEILKDYEGDLILSINSKNFPRFAKEVRDTVRENRGFNVYNVDSMTTIIYETNAIDITEQNPVEILELGQSIYDSLPNVFKDNSLPCEVYPFDLVDYLRKPKPEEPKYTFWTKRKTLKEYNNQLALWQRGEYDIDELALKITNNKTAQYVISPEETIDKVKSVINTIEAYNNSTPTENNQILIDHIEIKSNPVLEEDSDVKEH